MTVKELKRFCEDVIKDGYGDYNIVVAEDDEGNNYHDLFFPFMVNQEMVWWSIAHSRSTDRVSNINHSVILG